MGYEVMRKTGRHQDSPSPHPSPTKGRGMGQESVLFYLKVGVAADRKGI